jgi:hypothetical protein
MTDRTVPELIRGIHCKTVDLISRRPDDCGMHDPDHRRAIRWTTRAARRCSSTPVEEHAAILRALKPVIRRPQRRACSAHHAVIDDMLRITEVKGSSALEPWPPKKRRAIPRCRAKP